MDVKKLEAHLIMAGIRVPELCAQMGISRSAYYRKIRGQSEFKQSEISTIAQVCNMTRQTVCEIFFPDKVS